MTSRSARPAALPPESGSWPPEVAAAAAAAVCRLLGVDDRDLRRLPSGSNHVVHAAGSALVVRVAPPGWRDRLAAQCRLSAALVEQGVRVGRPAAGVLDVDVLGVRVSATVWSYERPEPGRPVDWRAVGELVRDFHAGGDRVAASGATGLPERDLHRHVGERLGALRAAVGERDSALLRDWHDRLVEELARVEWLLPPGVTHGDVQRANVVTTRCGPVLVDPDGFAVGPREVDLAWVAEEHLAGRLPDGDYRAFVAGVGTDVAGWPGLAVLARLRELSHTSWVLLRRDRHPEDAALAGRMLAWWRAGAPPGAARTGAVGS